MHVKESLNLRRVLWDVFHKDTICSKILAHLESHPRFGIQEGLIWTKNQLKQDIIYIPKEVFQRGRWLVKIIINHAHQVIGHYSQFKTSDYIRQSYWWPTMAADIEAFCASCAKFQMNKVARCSPKGYYTAFPSQKGHGSPSE